METWKFVVRVGRINEWDENQYPSYLLPLKFEAESAEDAAAIVEDIADGLQYGWEITIKKERST